MVRSLNKSCQSSTRKMSAIPSAFFAHKNGVNQVCLPAVWVDVTLTNKDYDLLNEFDEAVTYNFVATHSGVYHIDFRIAYNNIIFGDDTRIRLINGAGVSQLESNDRSAFGAPNIFIMVINTDWWLNAGDILHPQSYVSAVGCTIDGDKKWTSFNAHRIR